MKTIKVNVFQFDELDQEAKEKAMDELHLTDEYPWANDSLESLKKFAEILGIKIVDYSIDWYHPSRSKVKWKGHPADIFLPEYLTGFCHDYPLTKTWNERKSVNAAIENWLEATSQDYQYQFTEEYHEETCEGNGYMFLADGTPAMHIMKHQISEGK